MLLIYTHTITNRVKYTFDLVLKSVLGISYEITNNLETFEKNQGAKISYTTAPVSKELFFESTGLLFETGINASSFPSDIEKDMFASSFFLASRYEEYIPFVADNYGRFSASRSYSFKNNLLHRPMINIWADGLMKKIPGCYPEVTFPVKKYSYTPTIDIDNAYAYLGKSLGRTLGGYARAITKTDSDDFSKRMSVLNGKEKDPYDTYGLQAELHTKHKLKPVYFFLLGDWAENDKNLPHTSPVMQSLIKDIASKATTGIHPSFASNQMPEKIKVEKGRLKEITGKEITKSRQHFLKLRFPETYRNLITSGITDDYTMGFAEDIGFRAGLCTPFFWYDLKEEKQTQLTVHPFAVMDGTLNNYLKLSPEQAVEKVKNVIQEVKNVKGELITIWHNETLSDWREWRGWRDVYEKIIKLAQ